MAVYTRRLGSARISAGVWHELYRAPASGTSVIRDITVVNFATDAASESAIRIRPLTKAGEVWIWYAKGLGVGLVHVDLRQALVEGEAIEAYTSHQTLDVAVTGYVFE